MPLLLYTPHKWQPALQHGVEWKAGQPSSMGQAVKWQQWRATCKVDRSLTASKLYNLLILLHDDFPLFIDITRTLAF